jgi:hypothetical protein
MSTLRQAQLPPEAENSAALQALERLTKLRILLREAWGIYRVDPLAELRAEWEEEVERNGRGAI